MSVPPALETEFGTPTKRATSPTHKTWQSRMATLMKQADFGKFKFQPQSPPSSPPKTPAAGSNPVVDWDVMDSQSSAAGKKMPSTMPDYYSQHIHDEDFIKCICNRSLTQISCVGCGMMIEGRVRTPCPRHPNTIYLMDIDRCPACRATNLTETTAAALMMMGQAQSRPH